jgi:peptide deformylase
MSDVLTINTGGIVEEEIVPLPLYGEDFDMLSRVMPEYKESLPNLGMTRLVNRMKATMKTHSGLGLSANQCGVESRVFVIGTDQFQIACINPKITEVSAEIQKVREGCLSYPGLFLFVPRHTWIQAEYTTSEGELINIRMEGMTAQCFQHELDHMNGIKLSQHVGPLALSMAKKRKAKLMKKIMQTTTSPRFFESS